MITLRAQKEVKEGTLFVSVTASGPVDRKDVYGWAVLNHDLADRLIRAVHGGRAITVEGVKTDITGKTYAATNVAVTGRHMNADLRRLGY